MCGTFRRWLSSQGLGRGRHIVADSDPAAEVAETTAKFATALRALGADPELANR